MSDSESLSALIGEIYDAALDPALWPDVVKKSCDYVGGLSGGLYSKDSVSKTANIHYEFGVALNYIQSYVEKYVKLDPTTTGFFFSDIGEVVSTSDILPYDEFLGSRFYKEWVQPQGVVDMVTSVLEKSATSYAVLTVFRHERDGLTDEATRKRMRLLVPHIRRAMLIGRVIDLKTLEAATLADTLDGIAAGMILADARGQVVHANAAGHAILAAGDMLHAPFGRLAATDPRINETLGDILASAGSGDAAVGVKGVAIPLVARDGGRYMAHVLPLTSGARRKAGAEYSAAAAVFVRKAQLDAPAMPEVIAKLYGLTPSELRVLLAVFESGGVADIAGMLGISEATAKTHLRRLFEKTGTKRQANLVKLVAGFASSQVK